MAFFKVASVPLMGVYQSSGNFSKCASQSGPVDKKEDNYIKQTINLISKDTLSSLSKIYNISDNIKDYIFPVPRAVTANVPNGNGDRFDHEELTRFSAQHRCMVYQTFRNDPLQVEHVADDPKTARGFLPDVSYITGNKEDMYVIAVAAVDTTKDPALAEGLLNGSIKSFSMGCICEKVKCSVCGKMATNDHEMCDHLKFSKMSKINGKLVYEDCLGVEFQELSVVGNPADPTALTQAILKFEASKKTASQKQHFPAINTMLNTSDRREVARYFQANLGKMPEAMVKLATKLF